LMTALPDWIVSHPEGLTAADYEALPEEISRRIEIIDGAVLVNASPRRAHQIIARRLAHVLDEAANRRIAVATDVDLRLRDVPLLNRRPDVVLYEADLPDDAVLRPEHCVLVVEVMSPGSITADQNDKPAEYASAGIEHFWRIEDVDDTKRTLTVFRSRLDPTTHVYVPAGIDTGTLAVQEPISVVIDLSDLY
jgi:Uma2 family endonuclease